MSISFGAFVHIANLTIAIALATVLIHFIALNQITQILYRSDIKGNVLQYRHFIVCHTKCLLNIIKFDRVFGSLLLCYIATNIPVSALVSICIIQDKLPQHFKINFIQFLIGQFVPIFGIHWLAASYQKRIHNPAIRLRQLSIRTRYKAIRDQLYLANFIGVIQNSKFGISYAGVAPVSMYSLLKVN